MEHLTSKSSEQESIPGPGMSTRRSPRLTGPSPGASASTAAGPQAAMLSYPPPVRRLAKRVERRGRTSSFVFLAVFYTDLREPWACVWTDSLRRPDFFEPLHVCGGHLGDSQWPRSLISAMYSRPQGESGQDHQNATSPRTPPARIESGHFFWTKCDPNTHVPTLGEHHGGCLGPTLFCLKLNWALTPAYFYKYNHNTELVWSFNNMGNYGFRPATSTEHLVDVHL